MTKNLILFGAGASTGSDTFGVPPLGKGLLSALQEFNPGVWNKIPPKLINQLSDDFEKGMEKISNKYSRTLAPLQRSMANYFFQFNPNKNNLYIKLSSRMIDNNWDGAFATLNYERLLEKSMLSNNIPLSVGSSAGQQIEICFPHGCCHFFCSVKGSGNIQFSGNIQTGGNVETVSDPTQFRNRIQNDPFPPVMSYFIPSKFTTSCANFIKSQRNRFNDLVKNAQKIAIIGTMVREHDKHIWDSIAKTSGSITYCAGSSGIQYQKWTKKNRKNYQNDTILNTHWNESFDEICSNVDL